MPLYDYRCTHGHVDERFFHVPSQAEDTLPCRLCAAPATKLLSMGQGLVYFEEGRGRWIENLGHEPVYVTSHEQHKREMKKAGVAWANRDDMLHQKTRSALDARKADPHTVKEWFQQQKRSLQ